MMVATMNEGAEVLPDANAAAEFYARYELREILGRGVSSIVRRCIEKETNKDYAVKIIDLTSDNNGTECGPSSSTPGTLECQLEELRDSTMKEINILKMCKGQPHIVQLHDTFISSTYIFLVMELRAMRQLLEAVAFIHSNGVVHRDLKLENILLDDNYNVKVSDFGFASVVSHDQELNDLCGTVCYMAPEVFKVSIDEDAPGYGRPIDMWACGVILFSVLTGSQPFWHRKQAVMLRAIVTCQYSIDADPWQDISDSAKDMVTKLLIADPGQRLTAPEALAHPFIHAKEEESLAALFPNNIYQEMIDFTPRRRFKGSALAVVAASRLATPCTSPTADGTIPVSRIRSDPYGVAALRTLIDTGAFKIYHHWVKKNDNQSRAALFESSPRRDITLALSMEQDLPR